MRRWERGGSFTILESSSYHALPMCNAGKTKIYNQPPHFVGMCVRKISSTPPNTDYFQQDWQQFKNKEQAYICVIKHTMWHLYNI